MTIDRVRPEVAEETMPAGEVIQAYVRAKRARAAGRGEVEAAAGRLDRQVRERVDMLGFDSEKLLDVPPSQVVALLQSLEREALLEDAGVAPAGMGAGVPDGAGNEQTYRGWRDHRVRPGEHRRPARYGRRRQRGQR